MFKKLFDFSLFTNRLGPTGIARKTDIKRRVPERIFPKSSSSDKDT